MPNPNPNPKPIIICNKSFNTNNTINIVVFLSCPKPTKLKKVDCHIGCKECLFNAYNERYFIDNLERLIKQIIIYCNKKCAPKDVQFYFEDGYVFGFQPNGEMNMKSHYKTYKLYYNKEKQTYMIDKESIRRLKKVREEIKGTLPRLI